ncbi:transposable element Tcb1 transposase [Trichonephila clavipes]|nr:transposable element Tcb1 transposase [Trichonephila clavipes]
MNCLTASQALPWSARSPDFSPIEHIWDMMGRLLHLPGNADDLDQQLEQMWQEISQGTIRMLYLAIPRRVAACIHAREVDYVTLSKDAHDADPFIFGCSRDYSLVTGPCHPTCAGLVCVLRQSLLCLLEKGR